MGGSTVYRANIIYIMAELRDAGQNLPRPATGFLVKAELRLTRDNGIGVFADEFILADQKVYESKPDSYSEKEALKLLESMPDHGKKYWLDHAYGSQGRVCLDPDDIPMINHSDNPNMCNQLSSNLPIKSYGKAIHNIHKGEELTEDYRTYSPTPAYTNLCEKFGVREVYEEENYVK